MPKIDGDTIIFRIAFNYLSDIWNDRKRADVRLLDDEWAAVLRGAKYVQFNSPEGKTITRKITSTFFLKGQNHSVSFYGIFKDLYADVPWGSPEGRNFYIIHFEGEGEGNP